MPVQTSKAPTKPRAKPRPETAISYGAAQLGQEVRTVIRQGCRGAARRYRLSEHESDALANEVLTQVIARPMLARHRRGSARQVLAWIDQVQRMPEPQGYEQWQQAERWAERQHGLPEPNGYAHTHVRVAGRLVLRSRSDRMAALASLAFDHLRDSRKWVDSADGWMPRDQSKQAKRLTKFPKAPKAAVPLTVAEQAERFRAHEQEHGRVAPLTSIERLRELFTDEQEGIDHVEVSAHMAAEREAGEPLPPSAMAAHHVDLIPPMLAAAARYWWTPRDHQSAYVALANGAGEPHAAIAAELGVSTRTTKRLVKAGRALIIGQTDPSVLIAARRDAVLALGMAEPSTLPADEQERKQEITRRYLLAHAEQTVSTASRAAASRAAVAGLGGPLPGKRDSASTKPLSRFTKQWAGPADPPVPDSFPWPSVAERYGNGYGGSCSIGHIYRGAGRRVGTLG